MSECGLQLELSQCVRVYGAHQHLPEVGGGRGTFDDKCVRVQSVRVHCIRVQCVRVQCDRVQCVQMLEYSVSEFAL